MANIIISPGRYVQGKGELANLGQYTQTLGKKPLVLISKEGLEWFGYTLRTAFRNNLRFELFNGECSKNEISRMISLLGDCDFVVGVGGGKTADTAKAVGFYAKKPVVVVPTIASTDAPCSALSVIYSDTGVFEEYLFLPKNPDLVLVDTAIIAKAPVRLLVSGMGDALATYFEARAAKAAGSTNCAGGTPPSAALALARLCYDTVLAYGVQAKQDAQQRLCTESLEAIVEANTYLSGIGFESGGLAAAHAIHNGLTVLEGCHHMYHGEKVAFGTLVQLMLEGADTEEIANVIGFCLSVGLPVCLADLGLEGVHDRDILAVAKATCVEGETIWNMPMKVTVQKVFDAIKAADALGRHCKES